MKMIKGTTFTTSQLTDIITKKGLTPIQYNGETITFLGWGFEVILNVDGTYRINDTTGG